MERVFSRSWVIPTRKQKGVDQVKRVLPNFRSNRKTFDIHPYAYHSGCSSELDLSFLVQRLYFSRPQSTETLELLNLEALPIEKLNRKPTYEMIMLFVDENRKTFTVWVKKEWENGRIQQIGNLEDSQKQGIWIMVLQRGQRS